MDSQDEAGKLEMISAEDAVFEVEAVAEEVRSAVERIKLLRERLRSTLPKAQANDAGRQLDELGVGLGEMVEEAVDDLRARLMEWGIPLDEVGCERCGSADFSRQDCQACNAVRSDGLDLARRLAGWTI